MKCTKCLKLTIASKVATQVIGRRRVFGTVLGLAPLLLSCGLPNLPPSKLSIQAVPTGCGKTINATTTVSWLVKFTVSGADSATTVQWFFSDGLTATGESVVHRFDGGTAERAVDFHVTVTAGGDTLTQTYAIPMRGDPDGGPDPDGDMCIANEGARHISEGTQGCYNQHPPASGPHLSSGPPVTAPVSPGFYDEALPTERWLHNLEHGGVVLLYDCGGTCSDNLKAQLQALFDSVPPESLFGQKKMVITRYAGVPSNCPRTPNFPASGPFLAIAWDTQRPFDTLDGAGILDFYSRHVNHGPEPVPIPP